MTLFEGLTRQNMTESWWNGISLLVENFRTSQGEGSESFTAAWRVSNRDFDVEVFGDVPRGVLKRTHCPRARNQVLPKYVTELRTWRGLETSVWSVGQPLPLLPWQDFLVGITQKQFRDCIWCSFNCSSPFSVQKWRRTPNSQSTSELF